MVRAFSRPRGPLGPKQKSPERLQLEAHVARMAGEGASINAIALAIRRTRNVVIGIMHRNGIKSLNAPPASIKAKAGKPKINPGGAAPRLSAEKIEAVDAMLRDTAKPIAAIAAETGVSKWWIGNRARAHFPQRLVQHKNRWGSVSLYQAPRPGISADIAEVAEAAKNEAVANPDRFHLGAPLQVSAALQAWLDKISEGQISVFSTCQWIAGDPSIDATKCGQPAQPGKSYCPGHCLRAYTAAGNALARKPGQHAEEAA